MTTLAVGQASSNHHERSVPASRHGITVRSPLADRLRLQRDPESPLLAPLRQALPRLGGRSALSERLVSSSSARPYFPRPMPISQLVEHPHLPDADSRSVHCVT
jgi:hypothetical protein